MIPYYNERINNFTGEIQRLKSRLNLLSLARLLFFAGIGVSVYFMVKGFTFPGIAALIMFMLAFLWSIKKYSSVTQEIQYKKNLREVNKNEILSLQGDYSIFNNGDHFVDHDHPYTHDLDIFGEGSLYQYLNRATTSGGSKALAGWLQFPPDQTNEIITIQDAVKELGDKTHFRHHWMASGMEIDESDEDVKRFENWIHSPAKFYPKRFFHVTRWAMPILGLGVLSLVIAGMLPFSALVIVALTELSITGKYLREINRLHQQLSRQYQLIEKWSILMKFLEKAELHSEYITRLKKNLVLKSLASKKVKKLSRLMNFFDNRLNMVVSIFLNGLFLWDIQCVLWLEKWKIKNRQQTGKWFDAIYRFDALQCLGNFSFNNPGYAFPAVEDEGPVIEAEKLGHPLIDKAERVSNDFKQGKNGEIYLITGANMAGKSTFLRTVGINLVLARAGAPACAEKFNCQPREIFTSMRTSDSLKKNESYFYAELLRMKKLFQQLESPLKTYFILDEMLKGTNSADKLTGSGKLIREMIRLKGTGIIATHDLQLANLEEEYPGVIINRCFEIEIDNSNIIFDYKLKKGVTTKMNAMLLIDQMGLTGRKSI